LHILNRLMIFSIFNYSAWNISSSGIDGNMESSYFYICCHGNLNVLNILKVMGQGHAGFIHLGTHKIIFEDTEQKGIIMQFWVKVTGSRSKVASTQIFRATHLCPEIHPHTKYQSKIFIRRYRAEGNFGSERKGISVSRSQGRIDTILLRNTSLAPDTSSHQISTKNLQ
jgi:hypothetical protein